MVLPLLLSVLLATPGELRPPGVTVQRAEVIAQLTRHFRLKTVLLLRGADHQNSWSGQLLSVELTRYLTARNIPTAELPMNSPQQLTQCTRCDGSETRLLVTSDCQQVFEDHKSDDTVWLTFLERGQSLQQFVAGTNIRFDVQFLVAQPANGKVQLFEVYRVASDTPLRVRLYGAFGDPLGIPPYTYVYHRRRSLEGHVMKTASLNNSFLVWVEDNRIGGLFGELWGIMERHLNFTYDEAFTASVAQIVLWLLIQRRMFLSTFRNNFS